MNAGEGAQGGTPTTVRGGWNAGAAHIGVLAVTAFLSGFGAAAGAVEGGAAPGTLALMWAVSGVAVLATVGVAVRVRATYLTFWPGNSANGGTGSSGTGNGAQQDAPGSGADSDTGRGTDRGNGAVEFQNWVHHHVVDVADIAKVTSVNRWWSYLPLPMGVTVMSSPALELTTTDGRRLRVVAAAFMRPSGRHYQTVKDAFASVGLAIDENDADLL